MQEQPSSYQDYIGNRKTQWVKCEEILAYFSKSNPKLSYKAFVEEIDDLELISKLVLEDV